MLHLRISDAAKASIDGIRIYTLKEHGVSAMDRYDHLIKIVIGQLLEKPDRLGVRPSIKQPDCFQYSLSSSKEDAPIDGQVVKKPRHIVFFRVVDNRVLEIVEILKDDMDFKRHL